MTRLRGWLARGRGTLLSDSPQLFISELWCEELGPVRGHMSRWDSSPVPCLPAIMKWATLVHHAHQPSCSCLGASQSWTETTENRNKNKLFFLNFVLQVFGPSDEKLSSTGRVEILWVDSLGPFQNLPTKKCLKNQKTRCYIAPEAWMDPSNKMY